MIELRTKLVVGRDAAAVDIRGQLRLPFDLRQKTRLRTRLVSGEEVALMLPRGQILRGGDLLVASDGRVIEVQSQAEQVLHIICANAREFARVAYHLGNRHVPVQVGDGFLRIAADHVLSEMLLGLGATLEAREEPFEPEAGAYGAGGHGNSDEPGHGGRIHQYGTEQSQAHAHPHDHPHDHDHP